MSCIKPRCTIPFRSIPSSGFHLVLHLHSRRATNERVRQSLRTPASWTLRSSEKRHQTRCMVYQSNLVERADSNSIRSIVYAYQMTQNRLTVSKRLVQNTNTCFPQYRYTFLKIAKRGVRLNAACMQSHLPVILVSIQWLPEIPFLIMHMTVLYHASIRLKAKRMKHRPILFYAVQYLYGGTLIRLIAAKIMRRLHAMSSRRLAEEIPAKQVMETTVRLQLLAKIRNEGPCC